MTDGISIRPATRADAAEIALLVNAATHGLVSEGWAVDKDAEGTYSPMEVGRLRILNDEPFNWQKATMAASGDEVVGMLLGARDPDVPAPIPDDLPAHFLPFFELAVYAPGAWYISMLAVHVGWRGKGIGHRLLDIAEAKRDETGARGLSLIVEDINEGARRLYESRGFGVRAKRPMIRFPSGRPNGDDWLLMVKE
jgi:ribosomal protein S18 acetylase RimI-like enzyme